ncbi:hypothetical protein [Chitinophaga alhagiae]|uniref:hypothetical protein n=1 Tax=Chitinophaga alhagiae TaxID=2203219 RepID=UPI000E5B8D2C|nr:hypothetical protein [Chitinophaga alhagiae]
MHTGYMVDTGLEVLVFRTNIRFKKDLRLIGPVLDKQPGIQRWTVDREDSDKVLRIESRALRAQDVIRLVTRAGFDCEELPE